MNLLKNRHRSGPGRRHPSDVHRQLERRRPSHRELAPVEHDRGERVGGHQQPERIDRLIVGRTRTNPASRPTRWVARRGSRRRPVADWPGTRWWKPDSTRRCRQHTLVDRRQLGWRTDDRRRPARRLIGERAEQCQQLGIGRSHPGRRRSPSGARLAPRRRRSRPDPACPATDSGRSDSTAAARPHRPSPAPARAMTYPPLALPPMSHPSAISASYDPTARRTTAVARSKSPPTAGTIRPDRRRTEPSASIGWPGR